MSARLRRDLEVREALKRANLLREEDAKQRAAYAQKRAATSLEEFRQAELHSESAEKAWRAALGQDWSLARAWAAAAVEADALCAASRQKARRAALEAGEAMRAHAEALSRKGRLEEMHDQTRRRLAAWREEVRLQEFQDQALGRRHAR